MRQLAFISARLGILRFLVLLLILVLLLLPPFFLSGSAASAAPLALRQVAPGVYVHFGQHKDFEAGYDGDIANIGFVVGSEAVAVIDTGGSYATGMALKEALRAITLLPVRYVINTHGHPDHIFGNAAFMGDAGGAAPPQLIAHQRLPPFLARRGDQYRRNLARQLGDGAAGSLLIASTGGIGVGERLLLDLGGRQLALRAWPTAHTDHDLTVFDRASGALWTGDLLFIGRTPSLDGDLKGWLAATDAFAGDRATLMIPGHGPVTRDARHALARQRDYLATLLRDVRADIAAHRDMTQSMATAAAAERGGWLLFDVVNPRNVNLLYPALEWE